MDLSTVTVSANQKSTVLPSLTTVDPAIEAAFALVLPALAERQDPLLAVKDAASGSYIWVNEAMAHWLGGLSAYIEVRPGRSDADLMDVTSWSPPCCAAEQTALSQGLDALHPANTASSATASVTTTACCAWPRRPTPMAAACLC